VKGQEGKGLPRPQAGLVTPAIHSNIHIQIQYNTIQ